MASTVFRFDFDVPAGYLGAIDDSDLVPLSGEPVAEADSYEHWVLRGSDTSLVGLKQGKLLTKVGTTAWEDGWAKASGISSGYQSDFVDTGTQTQCGVFKVPTTGTNAGVILFGSLTTTAGDGGCAAFFTASENDRVYVTVRGAANSLSKAIPFSAGDSFFVAISENLAGSNRTLNIYIGGVGNTAITTSNAKTVSAHTLAIGSVYYTSSSFANGIMLAREFMIFDQYLTPTQLAAVYARSKSRMADLGITI